MSNEHGPKESIPNFLVSEGLGYGNIISGVTPLSALLTPAVGSDWQNYMKTIGSAGSITTHRGVDVYEVLWSADVTTSRDLRRPSIDEYRHGEPTWEQIT